MDDGGGVGGKMGVMEEGREWELALVCKMTKDSFLKQIHFLKVKINKYLKKVFLSHAKKISVKCYLI